MTREEAMTILLKAIEHACHFDGCPTIEMAHKIIRSEKADDPAQTMPFEDLLHYGSEHVAPSKGIVTSQGRMKLAYEQHIVAWDEDSGSTLTVCDLLDECEAAAEMLADMRSRGRLPHQTQAAATYFHAKHRRERLISPRSPTTADKGEGGDDRAS